MTRSYEKAVRRYDGHWLSETAIQRRKEYNRARTRAQTAMAREYRDENLALLAERPVRPWSHAAYDVIQRQVYRELARRHPDTYHRLLAVELAKERPGLINEGRAS